MSENEAQHTPLHVFYTPLLKLPCTNDTLYHLVEEEMIVLFISSLPHLQTCFQGAAKVECALARSIVSKWHLHGKVHLLGEAQAHQDRVLALHGLFCPPGSSGCWDDIIRLHISPYITPVLDHDAHIHLRIPIRRAGQTLRLPSSIFLPTILKTLHDTGELAGAYSSWGSSYQLHEETRQKMMDTVRYFMTRTREHPQYMKDDAHPWMCQLVHLVGMTNAIKMIH